MARFGPDGPVYAFSTENLRYVEKVVAPGDRVALVGSSGDQLIEACRAGARRAHLVDTNRGARGWSAVKLAALRLLPRRAFLDLLLPGPRSLSGPGLDAVLEGVDEHGRRFLEACGNLGGQALRAGGAFVSDHAIPGRETANCPYLQSDEAYGSARRGVAAAELCWTCAPIQSWLPLQESGSWDVVCLSNLADYSHRFGAAADHVQAFKRDFVDPAISQAPRGGRVVLYMYDRCNVLGSDARNPFNDSAVRRSVYGGITGWTLTELGLTGAIADGIGDAAILLERDNA